MADHPLHPSPSPDPEPLPFGPGSQHARSLRAYSKTAAEIPVGGPDRPPSTERAGYLFEELQLGGILQELPHGSRAIVGHEGFFTEGDRLLLGNRDGRGGLEERREGGQFLNSVRWHFYIYFIQSSFT